MDASSLEFQEDLVLASLFCIALMDAALLLQLKSLDLNYN